MGLEHLLTELLVSTRLDSIELKTVGVRVHVVILSEHVRDGVESGDDGEHHHDDDSLVGLLALSEVTDVFGDIVGHLRSR